MHSDTVSMRFSSSLVRRLECCPSPEKEMIIFVLKIYPAELKGRSHGTDVAGTHHILFTVLS